MAELPSLGETSACLLKEVGIEDYPTLVHHGAIGAFTVLRLRFGKRITVNWVYALECAIRMIDWRMLGADTKETLRTEARKVIHELEGRL